MHTPRRLAPPARRPRRRPLRFVTADDLMVTGVGTSRGASASTTSAISSTAQPTTWRLAKASPFARAPRGAPTSTTSTASSTPQRDPGGPGLTVLAGAIRCASLHGQRPISLAPAARPRRAERTTARAGVRGSAPRRAQARTVPLIVDAGYSSNQFGTLPYVSAASHRAVRAFGCWTGIRGFRDRTVT
jgi:hypothetical protein